MLGDLPRDVLVMVMARAGPQAQMNTLSKDLYEVLDVHTMHTHMLIKIVLNNFKEHPVITRYEKTLKALVVFRGFQDPGFAFWHNVSESPPSLVRVGAVVSRFGRQL